MAAWELTFSLEPKETLPVFLQIARAVVEDVRRGRLRPGDELPGSRSLARSLSVHRNTVLAAYNELAAEGWITMEAARGTFISRELPDRRPRRFTPAGRTQRASQPGFDLSPATETPGPQLPLPRGAFGLMGGLPDPRIAPVTAIARAYRNALSGRRATHLLDYGDPQGHERLRTALAQMLSATRGIPVGAESLVITRGSQMGLYLVARALISPGDVVAVEALGYRPAWEALKQAGARLVPLPVDGAGLEVDALSGLVARERVRAVYVTPHHQYPTTATLSAGRRLQLLELARRERLIVIEDDYDHEFHYDGRPILPLASADEAGVVVYVGTLSKILAPGLRLGYVAATKEVVERLASRRQFIDRQGDQAMEYAIAQLLEDGEVQRHARRARRVYQSRRDALVQALGDELGGVLTFQPPVGGIALWARAEGGLDVDAWAERCRAREVYFQVARRFAFDGRPRNFLRLGFAACSESELREAVRRMASVA